jgi:hypothetical protein
MDAYRKRLIRAGVRDDPANLVEILEEVRRRAGMRDVDAATAPLIEQREQLERRIESLREFERHYRAKLYNYFVGQIRAMSSGDMRPGFGELVDEASRMAKAEGGAQATGILLRDDGTYEHFTFFGGAAKQAEQEDEP